MEFEFFAWHTSITLKDDPLSQFKRKSERWQPHLLVNWAGMTQMYHNNASILPSFQSYNALICNILIFGIIFDYDFLNSISFWLKYGLRVLQKCLKLGPSDCIQMFKTSELPGAPPPPGALPLDPTRGPTAGPWTPPRFTLRLLHSLHSNFS